MWRLVVNNARFWDRKVLLDLEVFRWEVLGRRLWERKCDLSEVVNTRAECRKTIGRGLHRRPSRMLKAGGVFNI